jgi:hypothetical protein
MLNRKSAPLWLFGIFVNRHGGQFVKCLQSLGFGSFWINAMLWLPVRLALLEIRLKYGSLTNYLAHCDERRGSSHD